MRQKFDQASIRKEKIDARKNLTKEEVQARSLQVFENYLIHQHTVFSLLPNELKRLKPVIGLYSEMKNEVSTWRFLRHFNDSGIPCAFPFIKNNEIEFYLTRSPNESEPITPDIIFVPGVAFDKERFRIGYGRGFFDRYLSKHPTALKVGLAYEFQIAEIFEHNKHDIKMDFIFTDVSCLG